MKHTVILEIGEAREILGSEYYYLTDNEIMIMIEKFTTFSKLILKKI